jgi:hypothetical protein
LTSTLETASGTVKSAFAIEKGLLDVLRCLGGELSWPEDERMQRSG